jgi:hypothetical protein
MNNFIYHVNDLDYNKKHLIKEADELEFKPFELPTKHNSFWDHVPTWLQGWVGDAAVDEVNRIKDVIAERTGSKEIRPRYYRQEANTSLPMHSDNGTKCCINILLSGESAPIVFEDGFTQTSFHYECAILNIQQRHSVPTFPEERFLLKYSIFDIDFDEAVSSWINQGAMN